MATKQNALITVAELNAIAQVTITSGLDEKLIDYASQLIETICNRKFIAQDFTREKYNIESPTHYLYLKNFPIVSLTGVYYYDTQSDTLLQTYIENTDYIPYLADGYLYFHSRLSKGVGNIQVTYNGGYAIADVPSDLKMACAKLAVAIYSGGGLSGMASESIGNYSVSYAQGQIGINGVGFPMPLELYNIILGYRKPNI